jgi:hypothetical protein
MFNYQYLRGYKIVTKKLLSSKQFSIVLELGLVPLQVSLYLESFLQSFLALWVINFLWASICFLVKPRVNSRGALEDLILGRLVFLGSWWGIHRQGKALRIETIVILKLPWVQQNNFLEDRKLFFSRSEAIAD